MRIRDLARSSGVTVETVNYYLKLGILPPYRQTANGYREFGVEHNRRMESIKAAKDLHLTLGEIKLLIESHQDGETGCETAQTLLEAKLLEAKAEILQLQQFCEKAAGILDLSQTMDGCSQVDGSICALMDLCE